MRVKNLALMTAAGLALCACGRELALEERLEMTADDLLQIYDVTVYSTIEGAKSYRATASFRAGTGAEAPTMDLFAGDTLTLNGTAMTPVTDEDGVYAATGTGNPETFTFVWTHQETTYENELSAVAYPPVEIPTAIAKDEDLTIAVDGVPAGITVSATVNSGAKIGEPFFAVPVEVTGGGAAADDPSDLSGLEPGLGVLTLLEVAESELQNATAAGGSAKVTVQFGYNLTITD